MISRLFAGCLLGLLVASLLLGHVTGAELNGVKVIIIDDSGPAKLSIESTGKYELRVNIDPQTERKALTLQVELPTAGPGAWPLIDVAVRDSNTRAMPVRRGGIEWHRLLITVPPEQQTFFVYAVEPAGGSSAFRPEKDRQATDPKTGLSATISKWFDDRRAALSIRFDDSHPTHLSTAIPILNQYGFRGTFMVNPGGHPLNSRRRSAFEDQRDVWQAVAKRGDHEFANHTLNHRGASDDESMEQEIGEAAKLIWKLFPGQSKLAALNLGGGTQWVTTKPLRYYLDKYHLFDASANSTGMDDSYGRRIATFRALLEAHIRRGLWYKVHYHDIGAGRSTSESNFRAALDLAKEHRDKLWIAGMAEIYKYQTERRGAKLEMENKSESRVILKLSCMTELDLYDQPLTMNVAIPKSWAEEHVVITDITNHQINEMDVRSVSTPDGVKLQFEVRPADAEYQIERMTQPT